MAIYDCSPLADQNGRARRSLTKPEAWTLPAQKETEKPGKLWASLADIPFSGRGSLDAALRAAAEYEAKSGNVTPVATPRADQQVTMSEAQAEAIRRKLIEQRSRATAAEEKVASQERLIQQLSSALAKARAEDSGQGRPAAQTEEKTLELAAVRLELHQARQQLEFKESEVDLLLPEVAASRMKASQGSRKSDAEIDRLHLELDGSRAELARLRSKLDEAQQRLEQKDSELERMLPAIVASRANGSHRRHSTDLEFDQTRRELDSMRGELARKELELQQVRKDLEDKDSKLRHVTQTKDAEIDRLRRELDNSRGQCTQHRPELACLNQEAFNRSGPNRARPDEFEQARLDLELRLQEKKMRLMRREQAVAACEASLSPRFVDPGMVVMHRLTPSAAPLHGPHIEECGGLWERLGFARR